MRRQIWYPSKIADQIQWLERFRTALALHAATLNLPQAKVDAVIASCRYLVYVLSQWLPGVRAFGPASTQALDQLLDIPGNDPMVLPTFTAPALPAGVVAVPPGVLKRLFDLVAEIKESDTYTQAIGMELGIIGSENTAQHAAPKLRIEVVQGPSCQAAQINFTKFGHNGIWIECSVNGAGFQHLAIDTESPYLDARPLAAAGTPEVREYRARFWDKGTPNGEWTDVVKVTVGP